MSVYNLNDIDNWEIPGRPRAVSAVQPEPAPQAMQKEKQKKKGKGHGPIWVMIGLLVIGLIAQSFVMGALQSQSLGIVDSEINENGELILYYSDGSMDNLGVVVGQDGMDGEDGLDGSVGSSGSAGDVTDATALGLRSAVSVWCTFRQEGRGGRFTEYYSTGSGVIYRINKSEGNAFVITNYHVVFDSSSRTENGIAEEIVLYLYGGEISGREITATYVGGSQYYDIAVLRVEDSEVLRQSEAAAVKIADSDAVQVGSTAIAVGNPEGGGISASSGVISVDSEYITMTAADGYTEVSYRVMRIDTAVNSGNSGGGLFDQQGRLIGIVNAKIMDDSVENIGYALPSSSVKAVADNIIDFCFGTDCESVQRAILGVTVMTTDSSAVYDGDTGHVNIVETVEIYEVTPGQIGEVFRTGDVLVSVTIGENTKAITRQHHIIDMLMTARPGDVVEFTVLRDGVETALTITITEDCLTAY